LAFREPNLKLSDAQPFFCLKIPNPNLDKRDRDYDFAPGAPSMNFDHILKRFVEKSDVKLKLLHVKSGKIVKTFEGTYRWKDGESMPTFRFI
jgi:hypothetical protein